MKRAIVLVLVLGIALTGCGRLGVSGARDDGGETTVSTVEPTPAPSDSLDEIAALLDDAGDAIDQSSADLDEGESAEQQE